MRRWLDSGGPRTYLSIGGDKANSQDPMRWGNIPLTYYRIFDDPKETVLFVKED